MDKLFGPKEPQKPNMKQHVRQGKRDMNRERQQLQKQEKEIQAEIKKCLKRGDRSSASVLAKQLISVRNATSRTYKMDGQLTSMQHRATTAEVSNKMMGTMAKTGKIMGQMNKQNDAAKMQRTLQEFQKQSMQMDMSSEMLDDIMDDAMGDDPEEVDEAVSSVMDELNLNLGAELSGIKTGSSNLNASREAEPNDSELDDIVNQVLKQWDLPYAVSL